MKWIFFLHAGPKFPFGKERPPVFESLDSGAVRVLQSSLSGAGLGDSWEFTTNRPERLGDKVVVRVTLIPEKFGGMVRSSKAVLETLLDEDLVRPYKIPEIQLEQPLKLDDHRIWTV